MSAPPEVTALSGTVGQVADVVRFSWVDGPGNRYTVFLQGCNLNCITCHNPHTIARATPRARRATVGELVADIRRYAPYLSGVTASGGEATVQTAFLAELFTALRADPATTALTRFIDSNGHVDDPTWDVLLPVTDGVMLDLKALDPDAHRRLTGIDNTFVLTSLDRLYAAGRLAQVRLLVVPGYNDSAANLRRTGAYLAEHAPDVPVQVTGYRAHGVRAAARDIPEPTPEDRARYGALLRESLAPELLTVV